MSPSLPLEVIENVLVYLSPKELAGVSTICKSWNKSITRLLYRSVDIYSSGEYDDFIRSLENCNRRNLSKLDKNGYQVRRLFLHTYNILLGDAEINTLKTLCPMINVFDYAPHVGITDEHLCHFIPGWEHLTRLPRWHEDKQKDWIPKLGGQLTEIYCYIEELAFLPSFIGKNYNNTPLFPCLVDLKLSLHYIGPPISISWMEMLDDQCPMLTSLDMNFMAYGAGSGKMADWNPAKNLQTLKWHIDSLLDPIWYTYLSRKYLNVRELELQFGVDDYFDDFPSPEDQETKERMRVAHKNSIFNMITHFQHLTSLKIVLESKQRSYLHWYPLSELATWLGSLAAKNIKKLFWRTDAYQSVFSRHWDYGPEDDDADESISNESGQTMVAVGKLDPLGNIKILEELAYDVPRQMTECMKNLCSGTLVLENLTHLELFFSRNYNDTKTWEHLDVNTLLDGCPHLNFLGLAGVNSAVEGVTPAFQQHHYQQEKMDKQQQQQPIHSRLTQLRLHHAIINDDDYLANLLKRCPNVTQLKLYDCRIYQRRTLRRSPHPVGDDHHDPRPTIKAYTIDVPDHSLSLVDIRALRLMTFADAPQGYLFDTLEISLPGSCLTFFEHGDGHLDEDENNKYLIELICGYSDRRVFDLTASFGGGLCLQYYD